MTDEISKVELTFKKLQIILAKLNIKLKQLKVKKATPSKSNISFDLTNGM